MNSKQIVHLQSIGNIKGTPAGELKVGDRLMWNFGHVSTLVSVEYRGKSVYVRERSHEDGKIYSRRFLKTRLVARI